jgi:hypothetical protein
LIPCLRDAAGFETDSLNTFKRFMMVIMIMTILKQITIRVSRVLCGQDVSMTGTMRSTAQPHLQVRVPALMAGAGNQNALASAVRTHWAEVACEKALMMLDPA